MLQHLKVRNFGPNNYSCSQKKGIFFCENHTVLRQNKAIAATLCGINLRFPNYKHAFEGMTTLLHQMQTNHLQGCMQLIVKRCIVH